MPGRDGTGPMRPMPGRGRGIRRGANAVANGAGRGLGCRNGFGGGFGRGFGANFDSKKMDRELLEDQKEFLQAKLDIIDKRLESL